MLGFGKVKQKEAFVPSRVVNPNINFTVPEVNDQGEILVHAPNTKRVAEEPKEQEIEIEEGQQINIKVKQQPKQPDTLKETMNQYIEQVINSQRTPIKGIKGTIKIQGPFDVYGYKTTQESFVEVDLEEIAQPPPKKVEVTPEVKPVLSKPKPIFGNGDF
jgi:hypothetical protein